MAALASVQVTLVLHDPVGSFPPLPTDTLQLSAHYKNVKIESTPCVFFFIVLQPF